MTQMTKEQAINLAESEFWKGMSYHDRAKFQLFEDLLCMPFHVFHEAVEKSLNRPVWSHEFANIKALRKEFLGGKPQPSMKEILELIPKKKNGSLKKG